MDKLGKMPRAATFTMIGQWLSREAHGRKELLRVRIDIGRALPYILLPYSCDLVKCEVRAWHKAPGDYRDEGSATLSLSGVVGK